MLAPKNPKRKAYRDIRHQMHGHYLEHRRRMEGRKMKRANARATVRYYHNAGEAGGNRYDLQSGEVIKHSKKARPSKMAVMGMMQSLIGAMAKTGINRSQ